MPNDAIFSEDGRYRYTLRRTGLGGDGQCLFIMLNPSTATAETDDPTIRRCIGFARAWGYGELLVGNLFAYRATDPWELALPDDPVGPLNDQYLRAMARFAKRVVCAWGNGGAKELPKVRTAPYATRADYIKHYFEVERFGATHHLGLTKMGEPRHPLYLKKTTTPIEWNLGAIDHE